MSGLPLPAGWEQAVSTKKTGGAFDHNTGQYYYIETASRKTTWDHPGIQQQQPPQHNNYTAIHPAYSPQQQPQHVLYSNYNVTNLNQHQHQQHPQFNNINNHRKSEPYYLIIPQQHQPQHHHPNNPLSHSNQIPYQNQPNPIQQSQNPQQIPNSLRPGHQTSTQPNSSSTLNKRQTLPQQSQNHQQIPNSLKPGYQTSDKKENDSNQKSPEREKTNEEFEEAAYLASLDLQQQHHQQIPNSLKPGYQTSDKKENDSN
ncbi:12017_t:CDS:2, partial [Ambispora gerdemannii]